jgi:hypothetical protein
VYKRPLRDYDKFLSNQRLTHFINKRIMYKGLFTLYCIIITLTGIAQRNLTPGRAIRIALVSNHIDKEELFAITKLLSAQRDWSITLVSLAKIKKENSLNGFTHLWYHRTDTTVFDGEEFAVGLPIKEFVRKGGNLFLSMESVPLLNHWGIEQNTFQFRQDTLVDEGFGRPAGFHAFKSHPLFSGLNGGVYTSKQPKDHVVRKHGFFDGDAPEEGKVAGIQWTYITFSEQNKLLLEYNLGKGIIIAAGSYLYYNAENYNKEQLSYFTKNVFRYTAGQIRGVKKEYWNYKPRNISVSPFLLPNVKPVQATAWILPAPTLRVSQSLAKKDFYDLVGRRILWMGAMNGGADEIWMHTYMALRDLQIGVKITGTDSV